MNIHAPVGYKINENTRPATIFTNAAEAQRRAFDVLGINPRLQPLNEGLKLTKSGQLQDTSSLVFMRVSLRRPIVVEPGFRNFGGHLALLRAELSFIALSRMRKPHRPKGSPALQ